ncbi:O-antigen ligase family protein [Nitrospinae bacterium AH-259-F20]|nr:O-antigen ligase family protein [Nitrospinae bacterium AH-259-F20]
MSESVKNIAFGLALAGGLAFCCLRRGRGLRLYPVGWGQLGLVVAALISLPFALSPLQGLRGAWDLFRAFAVFALMANLLRSDRAVRWCVWAFLVGISVGAVWGISHFAWGYWEAKETGLIGVRHAVEIHSLGHPNHTATYLLMMLALALGVVVHGRSDPHLWRLGLGAAPLIAVALAFTYSRSALITALVVVATFGVFWWRKGGRARAWVVGSIIVCLILFVAAGARKTRSADLAHILKAPFTKGAMSDRFIVWGGVIRIMRTRPLVGVGPRNFNFMDKYRYGIQSSFHYFNHAHSMYFNVLAEMGLLGLGALFAWLFCYARACFGLLLGGSGQSLGRGLAVGATAALAVLMISGLVTTTLHTEGAMAISGLLGMALAERNYQGRTSRDSREQ